ncbi:porin [Martelella sp. HB161492]|uniref:porin n=1 Tax=Martelella sp. HB161492 TaxID=2720726 RepID=UPI001591900C|nr:porin [Martelella sp. HB161492]
MRTKSLLLGSVAFFAAHSAASAADPVVVVEPTASYVEVCDAFGSGYFYIPGGETCLSLSGYVRFQVEAVYGEAESWNVYTKAHLAISSKTDTELGILTGDIELNAYAYSGGNDNLLEPGGSVVELDTTYLALGGFQAGYFTSYWDEDLIGEIDHLSGNTKFNSIRYVFLNDGIVAGLSVDALTPDMVGSDESKLAKLGVSGRIGFSVGGVGMKLDAGYDTYNEEGALRLMSAFNLGPGELNIGANYATGWNAYANTYTPTGGSWSLDDVYTKWALAAGYTFNVTDKFAVTPSFQWTEADLPTGYKDEDYWQTGLLFEYTIVDGLVAKLNMEYADLPDSYFGDDLFGGWFRLERSF